MEKICENCKWAKDAKRGFRYEPQQPKFNEPWEPEENDTFYYLNSILNVEYDQMRRCYLEQIQPFYIDKGNCFKTREQAEQRAKEIKVYNLLKNFSDANWDVNSKERYAIYKSDMTKNFHIEEMSKFKNHFIPKIEFTSYEVAEEAFRRYGKELEELEK